MGTGGKVIITVVGAMLAKLVNTPPLGDLPSDVSPVHQEPSNRTHAVTSVRDVLNGTLFPKQALLVQRIANQCLKVKKVIIPLPLKRW